MSPFTKSLIKIVNSYIENISKTNGERNLITDKIYRYEKSDMIFYNFGSIVLKDHEIVSGLRMATDYEDYINGRNEKAINISVNSKQKKKSIFNLIIKDEPSHEVMSKHLKSLIFTGYKTPSYADFFTYAACANSPYAKKLILEIFNHMGEKPSHNSVLTDEFSLQIRTLSGFKFQENEYNHLHKFFQHHSKLIKNKDYSTEPQIFNFLKSSIQAEDWPLFSKYCPNNTWLKSNYKENLPLFEDNSKTVVNILINTSCIIDAYPYMASDSDLKHMIKEILDTFTRKGKDLNISHGFNSFISTEKAGIHFMSIENTPLDTDRIKNIFETLIEKYVSSFKKSLSVNNDILDSAFDYAFIDSITPLKKEDKKVHKI